MQVNKLTVYLPFDESNKLNNLLYFYFTGDAESKKAGKFPTPTVENVYKEWKPVDFGNPLRDATMYYAPPSLERVHLVRHHLSIFFMSALLRRASFWPPSMVYILVIITHLTKYNFLLILVQLIHRPTLWSYSNLN